ncbi:MAG TPA: DUF4230 domain-containing protein [Chloroflexi bacterium]|nr:DUF4230 domain-containing protein [Chloroflexota bacterium]
MMSSKLNTVILLMILVALVVLTVGGFALMRTLQKLTHPLEEARQTVEEQIEEIVQSTPTIIPDPMTIIRQVQGLSRLETASYTIEKVITAESGQGAFSFLFGDRLILVAHGQVIAGVDMEKMAAGDILIDGDRVIVTLPPAEVLVVTLDNQKSYIYDRDTGFVGMNPALETEARQAAEEEILQAALGDGILDMAQENAEVYIRNLILSLGFREVVFVRSTLPGGSLPTPTPVEP